MGASLVRVAALCVGLLLVASVAWAVQVKGSVVNRDGAAISGCRVGFSGQADYVALTNSEGAFYLDSPSYGSYTVTITQGDRRKTFDDVQVNQDGLSPSTLVVDW